MQIHRIQRKEVPKTQQGYRLPIQAQPIMISQGYNGPWSHFAFKLYNSGVLHDHRYSIDFAVPFGTEVLAARDGIVYGYENTSTQWYVGNDVRVGLMARSNFIILDHGDKFFTLYNHLEKFDPAKRSALPLRRGEEVTQGQLIARTGKSGWIGAFPNLHFAVFRQTKYFLTHPVQFDDYRGPLEHEDLPHTSLTDDRLASLQIKQRV